MTVFFMRRAITGCTNTRVVRNVDVLTSGISIVMIVLPTQSNLHTVRGYKEV